MNLAALRMMKIPPPVADDLMLREQAGAETMPDTVQDTVAAPPELRMTSLHKVEAVRDDPMPAAALRGRLESSLVGFALGVLSIGGMLLLWYLATKYRLDFYIRFNNIPSPGEVLERIVEVNQSPKFLNNIAISVRRILIGFTIASVLGVVMGVLIGRYRVIRQLSMPALEVLRPIPAIAWVPMAIMLWPSNEVSIVFITFIGAFFPILLNTVHGVEEIDDVLLRAARCLGTREIDLLMYVVIPGALQHIFTGLAVGMGVAWVSLIAAEMISGQFGIGYFTWEAYSLISYAEIALGMITIGVLGLLCSGAIRLCAKAMMPWMRCTGGRA
jgi:NitT/TauT family transport system permease protein